MIFKDACFSKTFIVGEYGVLAGGKGLILNHTPEFKLEVTPKIGENVPRWVHPESPVGKLYGLHQNILSRYHLEFLDPYSGAGGFGASGAQFVLLYRFLSSLDVKLDRLFDVFRSCDTSRGSGSDVLAQALGEGLVEVDPKGSHARRFSPWPFEDLAYMVCPTGKKSATHSHLESLERSQLEDFGRIAGDVISALETKNQGAFLSGIRSFAETSTQKGLVAPHTLRYLDQLSEESEILAAKGCGALGSDSLFVVSPKKSFRSVLKVLKDMGLAVISSHGSEQ